MRVFGAFDLPSDRASGHDLQPLGSPDDDVWIGIDGGATSVKASVVGVLDGRRLTVLGAGSERHFGAETGFRPLPLERQLTELAEGACERTAAERVAGDHRIQVYAQTVRDVIEQVPEIPGAGVCLALCAPGRTDADGAGLLAVRNGPRQPHFMDELEHALSADSAGPVIRPACIESDGTAAAWGEQFGVGGAFAGVRDAYSVGCGTGVSESLKLAGQLCDAARFPGRWRAPWMDDGTRPCAEDRISMPALMRRWQAACAQLSATTEGAAQAYPETAARAGSVAACRALEQTARALADFIADRYSLLRDCGVELQRIVLAQRAATLFSDPTLDACFATPLRARFARRHPQPGADPGFLVPSRLRCAPLLGTVARALGWPAEVD